MINQHTHTNFCSELSAHNYEAASAAIKLKRVESAAQFLSRATVYQAAQYAAPERLQEHLKGLVVIKPDYDKQAHDFIEKVHEASCPACDVQDGVLRLKIVGEVFGPPAFLAENLKGCHRVEMEIGDCLGGTGVKEFKDLIGDVEVVTTVTGYACSAGAYLAQLGSHRRIKHNAALLLHPRIRMMIGNLFTLRKAMKELEEFHETDVGYLVHRTGQPRVVVEAWLSGSDVCFDAQQAVELGLMDEIIQ